MSRVGDLEQAIRSLSPEELAQVRVWFAEFDCQARDQQLESDIESGGLDSIGKQAVRDHEAGRSKPL